MVARKAKGEKVAEKKVSKEKKPRDKRKYIGSWDDEKIMEVWTGLQSDDYTLGEDDIEILRDEIRSRKLSIDDEKTRNVIRKTSGEDNGKPSTEPRTPSTDTIDDEEEQVPIGYIKLYPKTPERNELYKKRYENAKKAWSNTNIIQKGENWYIVAKGKDEFGYDVHLFFTQGETAHGTCTCADFTQRGVRRTFPCKHIFMVLVHRGLTPEWK